MTCTFVKVNNSFILTRHPLWRSQWPMAVRWARCTMGSWTTSCCAWAFVCVVIAELLILWQSIWLIAPFTPWPDMLFPSCSFPGLLSWGLEKWQQKQEINTHLHSPNTHTHRPKYSTQMHTCPNTDMQDQIEKIYLKITEQTCTNKQWKPAHTHTHMHRQVNKQSAGNHIWLQCNLEQARTHQGLELYTCCVLG